MTAADRRRRLRRRHRAGERVAPVPITNQVIETLMDLGWLCEGESEDRSQIGEAVRHMLDDLARSQKKP